MRPERPVVVLRTLSCAAVIAAAWPLLTSPDLAARQQPPADTEVYLATVTPGADAGAPIAIAALINISRNAGYDNQPSFTPDGRAVLFSSNRDGKQTDVYRYDLASRQTTQITRSADSEYSPIVTPDGRGFSAIRLETNGTQLLWRFDLDGTNERILLEGLRVGYHVWIDATHLALFVLGGQGQPNTLQVADTATGQAVVVTSGIGRSLLRRPGREGITFISTAGPRWRVQELDPRTRAVRPLVETVDENRGQDAAWAPDGTLYMTSGSRLLSWREGQSGWREAADLASHGVQRLTRLAFAGDSRGGLTLAIVGEPVR